MRSRLTIAKIDTTKAPERGEIKLWDSSVAGLYLRLLPGGTRTWTFRYRTDGGGRGAKVRSLKLGSYPSLSLDAAREVAKGHIGQVAKGRDPAQLRKETRQRQRSTLGVLLAVDGVYENDLKARHIVKIKDQLSCLRRGLKHLFDTDIAKLTRAEVVEALDRLKHLPGARAELRKYARGLLEYAVNSGIASHNVMAGMRRPPLTRAQKLKQEARRRALSDSDIVALWRVATTKFGAVVRLAVVTGMRRGELAALRWSDITADRIVLPASVTKTGTVHEIPLTPLMRSVLDAQPRTTSELVFPSARTGGKMTSWGVAKPPLVDAAGIGDWSLHDMRRTTRTLMSRLNVPEPAAELAIGHVKASLIAIYNRDEQWAARVDAFARVSHHIAQLVAESRGESTD